MAVDRRRKYRKLLRDPSLCAAVIDRLKDGWSPEQIAVRLRLAGGVATRLSHETIHQYVYLQEGQDQQLARHLPERRRRRRPRYARKPRSLVFPIECAIRNRPDIINSRSELGHWEADLMIFRKEHGAANIATVVERKSRYTLLFRNNDRRSKPIMNQLIRHLAPLPVQARQSLTFDLGLEFVSWRELEHGMGTIAWFCDPQAPWQKGTVENTNKRVRRYLPPETIVLDVSNQEIRSLCDKLNGTPRKCLGFQTPKEIFSKHLLALEGQFGYYCVTARDMACERRARLRNLVRFSSVRRSVVDRIMHGWSTQQIAGRMRLERHLISVSHRTIYRFA
ncbi:IS30 family transposase [Neorhizobium galegae]|nr:IS30 family transposase [Neorhizobium galegae]